MDQKVTSQYTKTNPKPNTIKPIVQGIEQLQRLRIGAGNRIAAIHRQRISEETDISELGTMSPAEREAMEKEYASTLEKLQKEYARVTDGLIEKNYRRSKIGHLPTPKKFQPTSLINTYSELLLVDQYIRFIENEEINIAQLERALEEYPIWTQYLKELGGIGPKLGGVIISEIDIYRTKYVSNLWVYAGLDTVVYGEYVDEKGNTVQVSIAEIQAFYDVNSEETPMMIGGRPVTLKTKGRDRSRVSLVMREYKTAQGDTALRNSITFNPYLKTKLIGVLGASFLKQSSTTVDGERMGTGAREELAKTLGWKPKEGLGVTMKKAEVIKFLREQGHTVETSIGRFAKIYYDYRHRIENSLKPEHQGLTAGHIHNMAVRYMVKQFLRELYVVWRNMEGLPIYKDYATAKLGYTHDANAAVYRSLGIDPDSFVDPEDDPKEHLPFVQQYIKQRDVPVGIIQNA